jgi:signal peptidase II
MTTPPEGGGDRRPDYRRLAVVAGAVILLDQVTKAVVLATLPLHASVAVVPGFFNLTHILNPGGAFGFMAGQSPAVRKFLFLFISSAAVVLVFWFYRSTPRSQTFLSLAFALIFGGAIGNLVDRFRFGSVVDFLDFYVGVWHWPAFNVADSAITIGIGIFLLHLVTGKLPD